MQERKVSRSGAIAGSLLILMIVACGSGTEPPAADTKAEAACDTATATAAKALNDSLTAEAGDAKLGKIVTLSVDDTSGAPVQGYAETTVLAANLPVAGADGTTKDVPLMWVAGTEFANTGGGLVIGADNTTKSFSELGADVPASGPIGQYVAEVAGDTREDVLGCLK